MAQTIRILIVEDNPADAELLRRELRRAGFEPEGRCVDHEAEYVECLAPDLDVIVSDYQMPRFGALRALELLQASKLAVPFIIVSGTIGEETAVSAMRLGASDYLLKDRLARFGPAIRQALEQRELRRERQQAEEALHRREEDFRLLFASNPMPMWVYDLETLKFLAVNQAAIRHYGYSEEEFLSLTIRDIRPEEDVPFLMRNIAEGPKEVERSGTWRHRAKDGRSLLVVITSHITSFQGRGAKLVLVQDVTQQHANETALRESEERFRQVVENIREVFWMTDRTKNRVLYISPGYESVWGRSREDLYADPQAWAAAVHPEDRERLEASRAKQAVGDYDETFRIIRPDGAIRWIRARAFPVKGETGGGQRVVGVAEDITERKLLESQFLRAQRLESIGTLAGGIAHDLNNILAPMLMAAGLLKEAVTDARDREMLDMVERSARRGADIIRQLLTFSRGVEGARIALQPRHLIKELGTIIRETFPREIAFTEDVSHELWPVVADATQLHQVLVNLCVNARDAMPRGGKLTLAGANREVSAAEAVTRPGAAAGPHVVLTVSDTGTGMAPEVAERIFDPFFTTKEVGKGTGLGLSTVLGIVRSHGGFLTVYSEPGRGSAFGVYLPAVPESHECPAPSEGGPTLAGRGELVLVVDDEEPIREATRHLLQEHGYRVLLAANGKEGVEIFVQERDRVRLVLTDLMMPEMDGVAMIRALRLLEPNLKFIATSGLDSDDKTAELAALGLAEVVPKPCGTKELLRAIQKQFSSE